MKKILVFLFSIVVLSVCSCRSSKIDTTVHQDNTEQKRTEQEEVSTDDAANGIQLAEDELFATG